MRSRHWIVWEWLDPKNVYVLIRKGSFLWLVLVSTRATESFPKADATEAFNRAVLCKLGMRCQDWMCFARYNIFSR